MGEGGGALAAIMGAGIAMIIVYLLIAAVIIVSYMQKAQKLFNRPSVAS